MLAPLTRSLGRLHTDERGFTLIELMVAVLILTAGVVVLLGTFDSSRSLATSSEIRDTATAQAQKQIELLSSQPWAQLALSSSPGGSLTATPSDPRYYYSATTCDSSVSLPTHSPCYQWDWSDTTKVEPLVICTQSTDPGCTATGVDSPTAAWSTTVSASDANVRLQGTIYRYITWVVDPNCSGSGCGGTNAYKRITVAVTAAGLTKPVWLSTVTTNSAGGTTNPLTNSGTKCTDSGLTVPCVN